MIIDCFADGTLTGKKEFDCDFIRMPVEPMGHKGIREFRFQLPIIDIQGYWIPKLTYPTRGLMWIVENLSAPQYDIPYVAFMNAHQDNRASVAVDNFVNDIAITAKMDQEACTYQVTVKVAESKETSAYSLTVDLRKELYWTEALEQWVQGLDTKPGTFPAGAWDPVYCTWYVVHAAVTQDWVEQACRQASSLGFKTLIVDDGWSYPDMKRVSPQTIGTWYDTIGNWTVSPEKFPDFKGHVKRVQAMGMHYLVWTAPFLIGDGTDMYDEYKEAELQDRHTEGCVTFNPAYREKGDRIIDKLVAVMRDNQLDGLKIDFLDYIYPNVEAPHGPETLDFIARLSRRLREVKPDALMEFRQSYATPQMLAYATQFRAGDVPFDYIKNFGRIGQIRMALGDGDGVPVHADPLYWHPEETLENVSRHMIASLAGVPMLSMELSDLPKEHLDIIRYWLDFYREHQAVLNHGHWNVRFHPGGIDWQQATLGDESILILADGGRIQEALKAAAGKKLYLLNLSPDVLDVAGVHACDWFGHAVPGNAIPCGGMGIVDLS